MIVFHGTTEVIEHPDVTHSKKYLDFGEGFYLTTYEEQAKKWAVRKAMRQEKAAIVNMYEMNDNVANDDVFKTVDMYFRGLWDKSKVLEELRYYKMNNQICIANQKTINEVLIFAGSYEVV